MAASWQLIVAGRAWTASAANVCTLFNGSGSGVILRVWRVWVINAQTAAITATANTITLERATAASSFTTTGCNVAKHDTNSNNLPAQVLWGRDATVTRTDVFRRFFWDTNEPTVNAAYTSSELRTLPFFTCVWDSGYGQADLEPIVCREGQGVTLYSAAMSAAGNCDFVMEFTVA